MHIYPSNCACCRCSYRVSLIDECILRLAATRPEGVYTQRSSFSSKLCSFKLCRACLDTALIQVSAISVVTSYWYCYCLWDSEGVHYHLRS